MQYTGSNKAMVKMLVEHCYIFGIKHVILAPGSRNAPLIISFGNHPEFTCYSIPDERSAGFYALGMARELNEPVALVCTSGTAVLNLAPALTEAYYQEVPVVAITADRPPEWIDQEDGQTIRQEYIFQNHIRAAVNLPVENKDCDIVNAQGMLEQALNKAHGFPKGPVHINIPFQEPLYETEHIDFDVLKASILPRLNSNYNDLKADFLQQVQESEKIVILVGIQKPDKNIEILLNQLTELKNMVVLAPALANIAGNKIINNLDAIAQHALAQNIENLKPDLLLTFGGPVISKAAKQLFRFFRPFIHHDIDVNHYPVNTYEQLNFKITEESHIVLNDLKNSPAKSTDFQEQWLNLSKELQEQQKTFSKQIPWSDYRVYEVFNHWVNFPVDLHLANSTPVRYIELFTKNKNINYFGNRGTSGIDGSTSTAAGAALMATKDVYLITGDISFVYDSNALWNQHVPNNLKIIVINNGGGNIFRVIPGPALTQQLDDYFETRQTAHIQKICEAFEIKYLKATNTQSLAETLEILRNTNQCTVLEVFTDAQISAQHFKNLYQLFRNHKTQWK